MCLCGAPSARYDLNANSERLRKLTQRGPLKVRQPYTAVDLTAPQGSVEGRQPSSFESASPRSSSDGFGVWSPVMASTAAGRPYQ